MNAKSFLLILLVLGSSITSNAKSFLFIENDSAFSFSMDSQRELGNFESDASTGSTDRLAHFNTSRLAQKYSSAFHENKRLTAAMLTFALGMLGVHRLYLGTKPWIPAVYLLTFGGGFLILPLIDLGVILFCKDISKYEHNDKVLMWVK